ncbi:MAG TPA: class I SAM-dependent methyltransferase [Egibacteraceae bacterium]|nr:class I SAM-dependent methyltransferase [Egibacteraceae bacterium]
MRSLPVAGDQRVQGEILEDLRQATRYRRWLASLARPWLGANPIEIGSGLGDYAAEWARSVALFTASEADPQRLASLQERFNADPSVEVRELAAPLDEDAAHSSVVAYNVLEHIADDVAALRGFARLVVPGGRVILVVPAFELAMSRFDREIGHFRRYRRPSLIATLDAADLRLLRLHYVNAPGLLAWVLGMRLLGLRPKAGPLLAAWDALMPAVRTAEHWCPPPFGQSLFVVAETPAGDRPPRGDARGDSWAHEGGGADHFGTEVSVGNEVLRVTPIEGLDLEVSSAREFWRSQRLQPYYREHQPQTQLLIDRLAQIGAEAPITSVFEFGCNVGRNLHYIRGAFGPSIEVCGMDVNPDAVAAGRRYFGFTPDQLCVGDDESLTPLARNRFDVVVTVSVLDHLPEVTKVLDHLLRVARRRLVCIELDLGASGKVTGRVAGQEVVGYSYSFPYADIIRRLGGRVEIDEPVRLGPGILSRYRLVVAAPP